MFLQCVSTVIIVYIIISPLNSYLYIHWILDLLLYYIIITRVGLCLHNIPSPFLSDMDIFSVYDIVYSLKRWVFIIDLKQSIVLAFFI